MREEFISYIWLNKLIDLNNLKTVKGESIQVINSGSLNTDSGPDIFNAKICIGDLVWAGNIEIHVLASDWYKHKHQNDPSYNSIILHLVYDYDTEIKTKDGRIVPCLALKGKFDIALFKKFASLKFNTNWIPCEKNIHKISNLTWINCKDRMAVERLENKAEFVAALFKAKNKNWVETFYHLLAQAMGMKVNALPFQMLFNSISIKTIRRNSNDLFQTDTLLFGQAGMLEQPMNDLYHDLLREEFEYFRNKLKLKPMSGNMWKYHRMRPANFPTIRLAQLSYLLSFKIDFYTKITDDRFNIHKYLKTVSHSNYWETHYTFGKESKMKIKPLGKSIIDHIIINCISPFIFYYGKQNNKNNLVDLSIYYLEKLGAEKNSIINKWKSLAVKCENSLDSQALIQLKNEYCDRQKCLQCVIGNSLILND